MWAQGDVNQDVQARAGEESDCIPTNLRTRFPGLRQDLTPLLLQACPLLPSPHYSLSGPKPVTGVELGIGPGYSSYLECVFTWLFGTL